MAKIFPMRIFPVRQLNATKNRRPPDPEEAERAAAEDARRRSDRLLLRDLRAEARAASLDRRAARALEAQVAPAPMVPSWRDQGVIRFYHFTSRQHLRAIAQHGLCLGDVLLTHDTGAVAVCLTTEDDPRGHGLEGSRVDKTRYRMALDWDASDPALEKHDLWIRGWAKSRLANARYLAAINRNCRTETWYLYFGVIGPDQIRECVDLHSGEPLDWRSLLPRHDDVPGYAYEDRHVWHAKLLDAVRRMTEPHR